jgi:predicted nucleic-acid-binding protein
MISLIDTNIILRFLTADENVKYQNLHSFFNSIERGEINVELKLFVLFQVIFVLKRFYKIPKENIVDCLSKLLRYKGIMIKDKKIVLRNLDLWREKNLEIVDSYIISCLKGDKHNILYSYDRDFDKFSINRVEP